jgi:preprotein translocase subunit SecE
VKPNPGDERHKTMEMQKAKERFKFVAAVQTFFSEVFAEWKKIVWPTPEALMQATLTVLIMVVVLAVYMGLADFILRNLLEYIIK